MHDKGCHVEVWPFRWNIGFGVYVEVFFSSLLLSRAVFAAPLIITTGNKWAQYPLHSAIQGLIFLINVFFLLKKKKKARTKPYTVILSIPARVEVRLLFWKVPGIVVIIVNKSAGGVQ